MGASRNGQLGRSRADAAAPRVAVVVSRYNSTITDRLLAGAQRAFRARAGKAAAPRVIDAPGSFELPALAHAAAMTGDFDGVLALGCIIKGQTSHDRYLAQAVANGLVHATIVTGVPIAFGVLTVDSPKQAAARAGGKHGNKGEEGMEALLDTIEQIRRLWNEPIGSIGATSLRARPDKLARRAGGKR